MKQVLKTAALSLALALGMSAPSFAQDAPDTPKPEAKKPETKRPEGRRGGRRGPNIEELGLSEDQQAKWKAAEKAMREAMAEAREARDWNGMREARQDFEAATKKILTPEQLKKMEESRSARRGRRGGEGRGGRGGEGRDGRGGFGRGRRDPAQQTARRLEEIKKVLVLGATDETTLIPAIKKVLDQQNATRKTVSDSRKKLLEALKEGGDADAIKAHVAAYRKARDAAQAAAKKAQTDLTGQVSDEQKARLVALGVLD